MNEKLYSIALLLLFLLRTPLSAQVSGGFDVPDSLTLKDSSAVVKYDTLKPLFRSASLTNKHSAYRVSKKRFDFIDYIYLGDWLNYIPTGFLQNMGVMGFPNELNFNGKGNGSLSVSVDGIDFSDRLGRGTDAYWFRSEIVDTLEALNNTSSGVYSFDNRGSVLNLITNDKLAIKPLTHFRYYQAPNDEAFISAQFNLLPYKRLNISAGVSNRSVFSDYRNSEYGEWLGNIKARFMPNNKVNFLLNYYYANINSQLNGGVDFNKIASGNSPSRSNEILYSPIEATVNFTDRYQKITSNKIVLRSLFNYLGKEPVSLDLYYLSDLREFRQNESKKSNEYRFLKFNNRSKTFGAKVSGKFSTGGFNFNLNADYEYNNYVVSEFEAEGNYSKLSANATVSKNIFSGFFASLFGKYMLFNNNGYYSTGTEWNWSFGNRFSLSTGFSINNEPLSVIHSFYLNERNNIRRDFNLKATFENTHGKISLSYFRSISNKSVWNVQGFDTLKNPYVNSAFYDKYDVSGFNFIGEMEFLNILFESNVSYYFQKNAFDILTVPEWTARGGVYYVDTLFNSNLKMKAGINIYAQGKQSYRVYDYDKMLTAFVYSDKLGTINPFGGLTKESYQLDLFFSGMIRDRAILYLVVENITDNKYFIVPYYPRKGITFRFGFSWELYN